MNVVFPMDDILKHCRDEHPKECCGVVIVNRGVYKYTPCHNVHTSPVDNFVISPLDYASAEDEGEIVTIVHSHSDDVNPSKADIESQKAHGIDWLIVNPNGDLYWLRGDKEEVPLYGREYVWHVYDCGSFIIDFYKQEFDIQLPDFYRPERFWEKGIEMYLNVYEKAGFIEVGLKDIQYGDVLLMTLGTTVACHAAVYLGNNVIGHHLNKRLSSRDIYGKWYMDRTVKCLRHRDKLNG